MTPRCPKNARRMNPRATIAKIAFADCGRALRCRPSLHRQEYAGLSAISWGEGVRRRADFVIVARGFIRRALSPRRAALHRTPTT